MGGPGEDDRGGEGESGEEDGGDAQGESHRAAFRVRSFDEHESRDEEHPRIDGFAITSLSLTTITRGRSSEYDTGHDRSRVIAGERWW